MASQFAVPNVAYRWQIVLKKGRSCVHHQLLQDDNKESYLTTSKIGLLLSRAFSECHLSTVFCALFSALSAPTTAALVVLWQSGFNLPADTKGLYGTSDESNFMCMAKRTTTQTDYLYACETTRQMQ